MSLHTPMENGWKIRRHSFDKYLLRFFYVPGTGNGVAGKKWVLCAF